MLPLTSLNRIWSIFTGKALGKNSERFFSLLGEELNIDRFFFFKLNFLKKTISLMSALGRVPIISVPSSKSIGRSFQECTAISALLLTRSSLMSFVKTPISGISSRGVSWFKSPKVDLKICSILISGNNLFISLATSFA